MESVLRPGHLQYLERPRVDEILGKALKSPVVLVIGGAGYGKSHAVYSYLHKHNIAAAWIQFTERDNIGDRFWENYTRSVSMINKDAAEKLAKQGFPSSDQKFERYLTVPLENLNLKSGFVFVYDDFHLIHDKSVLRFLEHSIAMPFPNITSILISRKELIINLMNLFSKGLLASIIEHDLHFSKDEIQAFFSMQDIAVTPEILESVYQETEGWAFAVHMAAVSYKSSSEVKSRIRLTVYKLIESELMAQSSGKLRNFLIKLSLIDESAPELIRELARLQQPLSGAGQCEEDLIRQIVEIGSFIRFDEYRSVFTIHRLFREYLARFQYELDEQEKKDVYLTAARWCVRQNQKMDAIMYYEKAGDYAGVIEQINTLPLDLSEKALSLLIETIKRLPGDVSMHYAETYMMLSRFLLHISVLGEIKNKMLGIIKTYQERPESKSGNRILCACNISLGYVIKLLAPITGDFSFPEYFEKGHYYKIKWGEEVESPGPLSVAYVGSYVCRVGSEKPSEMERYIAALVKAIPHSAASMGGNMSGMEELARGELAFFKMNMEEAERFLREAVLKAREHDQYEIESRAFFYLLRTALFQGDTVLVKESRRILMGIIENEKYYNRFVHNDIYRGWFYAQLGESGKVPPWLKNVKGETRNNTILRGVELLVNARNCLREKNYNAALLALKQTAENAAYFIFGRIEAKALEAVCLYQMKDKQAAYAALEEARIFAEPNGLYTPFTELGKDMRSLVTQALKDASKIIPPDFLEKMRNQSSVYAKKIYRIAEDLASDLVLSGNTSLSHKESEVLFFLFQGLTQDEIAESSSRSSNTIKSIIKRIYEKLGAVNKADAIRIAMNKGILDWGNEKKPVRMSSGEKPKKTGENHKTARPLLLKKII